MSVNIQRTRYVIVLDNELIFCGLARNYQFKAITDIGDTAIKTYMTETKARASFLSSWWNGKKLLDEGRVQIVKVTESISAVEQVRRPLTVEELKALPVNDYVFIVALSKGIYEGYLRKCVVEG